MASLRFKRTEMVFCVGVIIKKQYILSSAHCFDNIPQRNIIIKTGSTSSKNIYGPNFTIKTLHVHPLYTGKSSIDSIPEHDIAVVEVK
jgi:secreted trypsin-like serine protease